MSHPQSTPRTGYRVQNHLARAYLNRIDGLTVVKSTAETYDGLLTEYTQWLRDENLTVLTATTEDVEQYIEMCVRRGNRKGTLSSKLSTIREMYRFIHLRTDASEHLALDPLRLTEIDLDEYNTPPKIEKDDLNRNEIRRLFDAFDSYRNRLMSIVGVETGIRNSDIRGLRLHDIHNDYIHVHQPKGSRPYDVPISDDLRFELDYWERNVRNGYTHAPTSEYTFPSQGGHKLESNESLNRLVKNAAEKAGIQREIGRSQLPQEYVESNDLTKNYRTWNRVTVHTLRHSFITLLHDAGVNITYRMLVSNHRDPNTNLMYTHSGNDVVEKIRENYDPPR